MLGSLEARTALHNRNKGVFGLGWHGGVRGPGAAWGRVGFQPRLWHPLRPVDASPSSVPGHLHAAAPSLRSRLRLRGFVGSSQSCLRATNVCVSLCTGARGTAGSLCWGLREGHRPTARWQEQQSPRSFRDHGPDPGGGQGTEQMALCCVPWSEGWRPTCLGPVGRGRGAQATLQPERPDTQAPHWTCSGASCM